MAKSKVQKDNYIVVQGWQISELKLKGNELLIYACIYGFSQADEQWFTGGRQYLADWTNSTKQGVQKNLNSLVSKGLLQKRENIINGVKFCDYRAMKPVVNKVSQGSQQSLLGGSQQSLPNNIDINNIDNNIEIREREVQYQKIVDMYHDTCVSFPSLKKLTASRKKTIKTILEIYTQEDLQILFAKAEASSFLKGSNGRGWSANFDWLIDKDNATKVLEGAYDDKPKHNKNSFNNGMQRQDDLTAIERMLLSKQNPPPTAATDESIRKRAEALQQQFKEAASK